MEQQRIHIIGMPFHSESLKLTTPTVIQNGNSHFTRILFDDAPLYFQTPRCETKQGVVTTAATKKAYYDIILDSNSETSHSPREFTAFVDWIQGLEDAAVKLLFSNGKMWFRDPLSEDDIRALFTSPLKPLKGGKQLALRVNLTTSLTRSNQYTCTVFDEAEKLVHLSYVTPEHQLISIIEVLGIRFTSSSFQLDVAAKQIAVVANQPLFQTCIIKKDVVPPPLPPPPPHAVSQQQSQQPLSGLLRPVSDNELINPTSLAVNDAISIHDPLKVYYTLYKAALKRAQCAKRESIQAFLDAKRIKNKYNLDIYEHECDNHDDAESDDSATGADSKLDSDGAVTNTNSSDSGSDNGSDPDTGSASKSESDADSDSDSDSDLKSVAGSKPPLTIADGPNVSLSVDELK
jgi:hypothetical protein